MSCGAGLKRFCQHRPLRGSTRAYDGLRPITNVCPPPIRCRSGFTREYGSGGNGERRVEIGQQAWTCPEGRRLAPWHPL
ncbi:hypothetical protein F7661_11540 [Pseudomonas sp. CFA]|nr:hypothetical protein F7661_11540 [Pseudomonas sp. CFA]